MVIIGAIYSQLCPVAPRGFCQFLRGGAGQPVFLRGGASIPDVYDDVDFNQPHNEKFNQEKANAVFAEHASKDLFGNIQDNHQYACSKFAGVFLYM